MKATRYIGYVVWYPGNKQKEMRCTGHDHESRDAAADCAEKAWSAAGHSGDHTVGTTNK